MESVRPLVAPHSISRRAGSTHQPTEAEHGAGRVAFTWIEKRVPVWLHRAYLMQSMESEKNSASNCQHQQYEAQLFGATPQGIVDSLYNIYFDYLQDHTSVLKEVATKICQDDKQVGNKIDAIFDENVVKVNKYFDCLEVFLLSNVMNIPPHILLPEDSVHRSSTTFALLRVEVDKLKQEIMQEKAKRVMLLQELEQQKAIEKELMDTEEHIQNLISQVEDMKQDNPIAMETQMSAVKQGVH